MAFACAYAKRHLLKINIFLKFLATDTVNTCKHISFIYRIWHSSTAYAIALEAKCGGEMNIPAKGNAIYQWPSDLLKPSAVLFLHLCESDRLKRIETREEAETNEELQLRNSQLLRQRQVFKPPCRGAQMG